MERVSKVVPTNPTGETLVEFARCLDEDRLDLALYSLIPDLAIL